ncbi:MAG: 4-alpha-glucanotransferase [Chloroflexota bacterium]|nr:4-alpha-glucanotransferase [Chloroflexota bacterium]
MSFPRESGILLHPTSLPGPHGIGDFGAAAFRFVDWLADAGQRLWQIMPLGPTGYGDSPYSSPSAFAGNPLLISLTWLQGDGLLEDHDLDDTPSFPLEQVDFGIVSEFKDRLLRTSFDRFKGSAGDRQRTAYDQFCIEEAWWLDDYALFMAIKRANDMCGWQDWDEPIRIRGESAVADASVDLADELAFTRYVQFQFERQWLELRAYANARGIRIIGDIPIFVAEDSSDVWANQPQFKIDAEGRALAVAGVPPDPFSATGQIWGNPLYDWRVMREDDFLWWRQRIGRTLQLVDIVRIDHFRAFGAAWVVPAGADTAATGHWERTPGGDVFAAIRRQFGNVPVIIEDLGVITPDVISLREILGFPGMNVLQFAFGNDPSNVYLPHNYKRNSVVYTATHDNQTTIGWFASRPEDERQAIQQYLGRDGGDIAWDLIRLALSSVADTSILTMQDVLRLPDEARMNVPGQALGNWSWRCEARQLTLELAHGLRELTWLYGRAADDGARRSPNPWDYTIPDGAHQALQP